MEAVFDRFSFKTFSGHMSIAWSLLAHASLIVLLPLILNINIGPTGIVDSEIEFDYDVLAAAPPPAAEVKPMVRAKTSVAPTETKTVPDTSPRELQDEKGEVSGTQTKVVQQPVGAESEGTALATPYYKIKPKYPRAALVSGVEGWILLAVDVTESGEVENIRVVGGEQREMFQSEARRAVAQWKYRPFVDSGGHPIRKIDHQVKVEFRLDENEQGG